jgi:anion-transporting  ArsA/GET3 family ATPase
MHPAIPSQVRLHVVTGKGGTGKTTVAAALALALADTGKNVLLVEVEGRQSIAQLFDLSPLPYAETQLRGAAAGGSLWGLAIDAEEAMIEYLDMFYNLKRSARGLRRLGAVDFVTTLAPGLRDVLLTGKVKEAVTRTDPHGRPAYAAVVLDAPPTGRIARFLDATKQVASLAKVGAIQRQSAGVIDLLHGPLTAVHLVTLLEEMPIQETIDAANELAGSGFPLGAVIVNRARPELGSVRQLAATGTDRTLLAEGLAEAGIGAEHVNALAKQIRRYAQQQQLQDENAARLDELNLPCIELPDLNPPVELAELTELAAHFSQAREDNWSRHSGGAADSAQAGRAIP